MHPDDNSRTYDRVLVACGAILGGLAVALGAFAAHALKGRLTDEAIGWWQTAVQYQMWHALAVLAIGLSEVRRARPAAQLMIAGVIVFSGTLYVLAAGAPRWLGAVTPLGGLAMICGWVLLAVTLWRQGSR